MACDLKNILLIANPASQNGHGAFLAERAMEALFHQMEDSEIEVILTTHPHHATEIAASAEDFDTLIAVAMPSPQRSHSPLMSDASTGATSQRRSHSVLMQPSPWIP